MKSSNKTKDPAEMNTVKHVNGLNAFYTTLLVRFDFSAEHWKIRDKVNSASSQEANGQEPLMKEEGVCHVFHNLNPSKATCSDRVSPHVLKTEFLSCVLGMTQSLYVGKLLALCLYQRKLPSPPIK